jgi:hypothetical protein
MKLVIFKSNGVFFAVLFFVWIGIMYAVYFNHPYYPPPAPSELESYKAAAAVAVPNR